MKRLLLLLCMCVGTFAACDSFPESTFDLSPDSRLPRWFKIPASLHRGDMTVTMSYYVKPTGRDATFDLYDSKKHKVAQVSGTLSGLEPKRLRRAASDSPAAYPSYEVVTVNGTVEVVEHRRMEPIFYITDDPAVLRALGVTAN
jgi:hypothetical protein